MALTRAMGTLSTSGISPVNGPAGQGSGVAGEVVIFLFLIPALSRRFWPGGSELSTGDNWLEDPELRMAAGVVLLVSVVLFARHFVGAIDASPAGAVGLFESLDSAVSAAWGGIFNGLSYLTTTGWNSLEWQGARNWSGLSSPGLMLAGLAMMGGGVATTAGGVKLLRVYALARHSERELERVVHMNSVAGGGYGGAAAAPRGGLSGLHLFHAVCQLDRGGGDADFHSGDRVRQRHHPVDRGADQYRPAGRGDPADADLSGLGGDGRRPVGGGGPACPRSPRPFWPGR